MLVHNPTRFFLKKICEDAEAKFGMAELLLGGQGKKDFIRFNKTTTKSSVASDIAASIAAPRGITQGSFKMILDKFKNQALKDFAVRHQVNNDGKCSVVQKYD